MTARRNSIWRHPDVRLKEKHEIFAALTEQQPGIWRGKIGGLSAGYHEVHFIVNGVETIHPEVPAGYAGYNGQGSFACNYFEIPEPEFCYPQLANVPHGMLHMEWYRKEEWRIPPVLCVYTGRI